MIESRSLRTFLVLVALALLAGCGTHHRPPATPPAVPMRGNVQEGLSSWYGKEFDGRPTASGERFDMNGLTAAHRTLPLGTRVRVTNLETGRKADLTINDRGPFIAGRVLDCSYGAAKELGFAGAGLAKVRIEVISQGREVPRRTPPAGEVLVGSPGSPGAVLDGTFTVQAGAFVNVDNATRFRDKLAGVFGDAYVIKFRDFYRVRVGHVATEDEAESLRQRVKGYGIESFVTRND